jgi:hypothetical protein
MVDRGGAAAGVGFLARGLIAAEGGSSCRSRSDWDETIPTLRWLLTLGAGGSVSQCAMRAGRRSMMFAVKSDDDEGIQRE